MNVPFRVASTAALSNEHLPSPAQFVLVDNTSNQWLYQPDAQRYIAPYAMNITMPLTVASGANMQVAAPPGVTQAAPIAGQQYLAVFSDTEPSGLPYTSQTNVEMTNGTVDATITGGTVDATITGTADVNITNATLDATIQNATLDVNATLVHTLINGILSLNTAMANGWNYLGWGGSPIAGFSLQLSPSSVAALLTVGTSPTSGGAVTQFWQGSLAPGQIVTVMMPGGLAIPGQTFIAFNNPNAGAIVIIGAVYPAT